MRVKKRIELRDDEVIMVKLNQAPFSIRLTCCDCGLTHDVKMLRWEQLGDDEVEMIFHRNNRSTALNRSWRKGKRDSGNKHNRDSK